MAVFPSTTTHIDVVVDKSRTVVNLMRYLAGCAWGAWREVLLMVYRAMISPVLDYGCLALGSVAKTTL